MMQQQKTLASVEGIDRSHTIATFPTPLHRSNQNNPKASLRLSDTSEHGKLPPTPGPNQLLLPHGRVINHRSRLHIFGGAKARLIIGRETPGPGLALVRDHNTRIRAGSRVDDLAHFRDRRRHHEDTRRLGLVADDGVVGEVGDIETGLAAVDAAPDEALAVGGDGKGVVGPTGEGNDVLVREAGDDGRLEDDGFVFARVVFVPGLAEVVEAPGPDFAGGVDGEGVVGAAVDVGDFVARKPELTRDEPVHARALDDATAQLVLLPGAPGGDVAFGVEGEDVVVAADDAGDFREAGDAHEGSLDLRVGGEAQDAFVALWLVVSEVRKEVEGEGSLLGKFHIRRRDLRL